MGSLEDSAKALADRIRRSFEPWPVPTYPPLLGLDPIGEDEYAAFANVTWPDVPAASFRWTGYDICPVAGFRASPHMWSYYFPGFITAALLCEGTHDVIDGLMWQLRDIERSATVHASSPWWAGDTIFANYSHDQVDCVVQFMQFVRDQGSAGPCSYMWEPPDDLALQRWVAARG